MLTAKSIKFPTLVRVYTVKFASDTSRAQGFSRLMMDLLVDSHCQGYSIWPMLISALRGFSKIGQHYLELSPSKILPININSESRDQLGQLYLNSFFCRTELSMCNINHTLISILLNDHYFSSPE